MSSKQEILHLITALSEYECSHLLSTFQNVTAGERAWELEISAVYNDHVKTRLSQRDQRVDEVVPAGPDKSGGIFAPVPILKSYPDAPRFALPQPEPLSDPIGAVMGRRRSRRDYSDTPISVAQLSTLLSHAAGVNGFMSGYGYNRLPLRQFPSSGGLQAPEIYLSIQAVDDIGPGIYHYHPLDHALERIREGQHAPILNSLGFQQAFLARSAVVLIITGCFERLRWKYGQRAYKYMCMDAGYLGENVYLVAEAMGLGCCSIAGFVEDAMEQLIGVDPRHEMVLLLTAIGSL